LTASERGRALADGVPPPAPEEAYYPLRAVAPHIVEGIANEVSRRASQDPAERANAPHLAALTRAVARGRRRGDPGRSVGSDESGGRTATGMVE
jgi:hypothetical protein